MARKKQKKMPHRAALTLLGILALAAAITLVVLSIRWSDGATVSQQGNDASLDLPLNVRRAEDVTIDAEGHRHYPGAVMGIDVSAHQGEIDWQRVKDAGVEFAILRIGFRGYTAGTLNEDESFRANLAGAKAAGIKLGVYFFSQAVSTQEAEEEADYTVQLLAGETLDYPVFFDWEENFNEDSRTLDHGTYDVGDYALAFCKRMTEQGYDAGVYFNQRYGYTIMQLERLADYCFWLAEYNEAPSFLYDFRIWQYTGRGTVDGIDTIVDLNLDFRGE